MEELLIVAIGLAITAILALIKVAFTLVALTWFWVWVPVFAALLIAFGVWMPDFLD